MAVEPTFDPPTRTATALVAALVGLSVPFAGLLGTTHPVAMVGGGLFALVGILAVRAMDRDSGTAAPTNTTTGGAS